MPPPACVSHDFETLLRSIRYLHQNLETENLTLRGLVPVLVTPTEAEPRSPPCVAEPTERTILMTPARSPKEPNTPPVLYARKVCRIAPSPRMAYDPAFFEVGVPDISEFQPEGEEKCSISESLEKSLENPVRVFSGQSLVEKISEMSALSAMEQRKHLPPLNESRSIDGVELSAQLEKRSVVNFRTSIMSHLTTLSQEDRDRVMQTLNNRHTVQTISPEDKKAGYQNKWGESISASSKSSNGKSTKSMKNWNSMINETQRLEKLAKLTHWQKFCIWRKEFLRWGKTASFAEIASTLFDPIMTIVIVLNILLLGISVETGSWVGWFWVDFVFTCIFSLELGMKIKLFGIRNFLFGRQKIWHAFDFAIVVLSIVDLSMYSEEDASNGGNAIETLRAVRFFRLGRLLRVLRSPSAKELIMLMKGMRGGFRTLVWSVMLVMIPVYILGLILAQTMGSEPDAPSYFDSLPNCMYTLVRCMLGDCNDHNGRPLSLIISDRYGWHMGFFYCAFLWVVIAGVFNLIAAIFVQNAIGHAQFDEAFQRRLRTIEDQNSLFHIKDLIILLWKLDQELNQRLSFPSTNLARDGYFKDPISILEDARDIKIDEELYDALTQSEDGRRIFCNLGIQGNIEDLFQILDADASGELDLSELVEGIFRLRGDAKKSDLVSLSYSIRAFQIATKLQFENLTAIMQGMASTSQSSMPMPTLEFKTRQTMLPKFLAKSASDLSSVPTS